MAERSTKQLLVKDLTDNITKEHITLVLQNKRRQGGGPIDNIELIKNGDKLSAIVTFEKPKAVDTIMNRGDTVKINDVTVRLKRFFPKASQKSKAEKINSSEGSDCINQWEATIKAEVKDLKKSKTYYILYFEDENTSQGPFLEDTLLLDGLKKNLYVTFQTKKAALATANLKHDIENSNILSVEMATEEDFDTYNNLLSVHGFFCDNDAQKRQLMELVAKQTEMEVEEIIQQEEPRSAIIIFKEKTCNDISEATWKPIYHNNIQLVVAPVFKSNSVKICNIDPLCPDYMMKCYAENKKRSNGGKLKLFERLNETEAIVTFKERNACEKFLAKPDHELDGKKLQVKLYFKCLSSEVYEQHVKPIMQQVQETTNLNLEKEAPELLMKTQVSLTLPEKLNCNISQLYTTFEFKLFENLHYIVRLYKFGKLFLENHTTELQELLHSKQCKHHFLPAGDLILHLDLKSTKTSKESKEIIQSGLHELLVYLDSFMVAHAEVDKSCIKEFQAFSQIQCQKQTPVVEAFFDFEDNSAIFFSNHEDLWLKEFVDSTYQRFLSSINDNIETPSNVDVIEHELTLEKTVTLEDKDIIMLDKFNFHKDIENTCKPLKLILNSECKQVVIKGNDMNNIEHAELELLKKTLTFGVYNLHDLFSQEQYELLKKDDVQKSINKQFEENNYHAHFQCYDINAINLFYEKGVSDTEIKAIINSHVTLKKIDLTDDMELLFNSQQGQQFLSKLCQGTDGAAATSSITIQRNCLQIIALPKNINVIKDAVSIFVEENKFSEKKVHFSSGKQTFLKRFFENNYSKVKQSLKSVGVRILHNSESFTIEGIKDGLGLAESELFTLSGQILFGYIRLEFFGIKEFLLTTDGKSLLTTIENDMSCVIQQTYSNFKITDNFHQAEQPRIEPKLILSAKVQECSFLFMHGNITNLEIDAIVNPLDSTLEFQTGLGKALISKGGPEIQDELLALDRQEFPWKVAETSAGNLSNCKKIIHVICPVFAKTEVNELEAAMTECLSRAKNLDIKSLAMSAIGTGQIFKFQPIVACMVLMRSLRNHLLDTSSCLRKICFCDIDLENVKTLIERFKHVFKVQVEEVEEMQKNVKPIKTDIKRNKIKFGSVKLTIKKGDLLEEKCDVVVSSIKESLDLSDSGAVSKVLLKKCGSVLQSECKAKEVEMEENGFIVTSAPNLKCKQIYHISIDKFHQHLDKCVPLILADAENKNHTTIALPAFGSGVAGADCKDIKKKILAGVETFSKKNHGILKDVRLVLLDQKLLDVFLSESDCHNTISSKGHEGGSKQEKHFNSVRLTIKHGDITTEECDAIISGLKETMNLSDSGAVSQVLIKKCGQELQNECSDKKDEMIANGFIVTSALNLKCKEVYHISIDKYHQCWNQCVLKVLVDAERRNLTSIAMPAFGSGVLFANYKDIKQKIFSGVENFSKKSQGTLKDVRLVIYDKKLLKMFFSESDSDGNKIFNDGDNNGHNFSISQEDIQVNSKQKEIQFKSVKLIIKKGDILAEKCDAVVSGVRNSLNLSNSGAISKALLNKCGSMLQSECNEKKEEMIKKGFITTSAPNLNCHHIYHVSMDKFDLKWDKCVTKVLKDAENQSFTSIALPAFGSGVQNADCKQIKKTILKGVDNFSKKSLGTLTDVRLVLFSPDILDEFVSERDSQLPSYGYGANSPSQPIKVSDYVNLKIHAEKQQTIASVKMQLSDTFKKAFRKIEEEKKDVKLLYSYQMKQLEKEARKHYVMVSVSVEKSLVTMQSFSTEGLIRVSNLTNQLINDAVKNHLKAQQNAVKAATQWQFEKDGKWKNFESHLNSELEMEYKRKSKKLIVTDDNDKKWLVVFDKSKRYLVDENGLKCGDSTRVRRYDSTKVGEPLPSTWESMEASEVVKLVPLLPRSEEYKLAENLFIDGGAKATIKKIQRIQNIALYQQYKAKQREMDIRNPVGHKNEKLLFHGTDSDTVEKILINGFNRNYCGKNATFYGNGVYFAVNSSYSVGYAKPSPSGDCHMFIARVLTGESTSSKHGMVHLPNKPGTITPYDSGSATDMFIIFHDSQAYPEYLIIFQ